MRVAEAHERAGGHGPEAAEAAGRSGTELISSVSHGVSSTGRTFFHPAAD